MIEKIISGGQTGADIAALRIAKSLGIKTGGWMPLGFRTLDGDKPEYGDEYGMWEHSEHGYPPRTYMNVLESDGTVRFAFNFDSPGERCTLKAIQRYNKSYFDVNISPAQRENYMDMLPNPAHLAAWLDENSIKVLNVAGNADKNIQGYVEAYLLTALELFGVRTY